jgi:hypothetical protein
MAQKQVFTRPSGVQNEHGKRITRTTSTKERNRYVCISLEPNLDANGDQTLFIYVERELYN